MWFDRAVSRQAGTATSPDRSFTLTKVDSIDSGLAAHDRRCARSRSIMGALALDDVVEGRGTRSRLGAVSPVLRELAQHAGHADILREQLLAERSD